jgi:F-type H+-transporting ATPase subunit delta
VSDADRIKGYAAGLLEIARGEGQLDRVERELYQVARAVEGSEELRSTLSDLRVPIDRKRGIVGDLLGGRASELTVAAIDFIVASGRAKELPEIADALAEAAAATRSREVAEIRSAVELDEETVRRLEAALGKATGKQVEVKVVVDPSVVGGIVARVGDTVIDGSVRRRLDSLRHALRAG